MREQQSRPAPRASLPRGASLLSFLLGCLLAASAVAGPQVVVIGFDGADAALTRRYLEEGRLPHLQRLARDGSFEALLPTNPPQTPVSWSTFATGLNPGRTEIFDFLKRVPGRYEPAFCAFDETHRRPFFLGERNALAFGAVGATLGLVPLAFAVGRRRRRRRLLLLLGGGLLVVGAAAGSVAGARLLPSTVPDPINNRKGATFWELASRAGLTARVLRVPLTFPADRHEGVEMISGLGVPDLRGVVGQPTLYTTRPGLSGGQFAISCIRIPDPAAGPVDTVIEGPRLGVLFPERAWDVDGAEVERCNPNEGRGLPPRLHVPLRLQSLGAGRLAIDAGGTSSEVGPGEWTAWHDVEFAFNAVVSARGMVRFYNQSRPDGDGRIELVMSPVQFHPSAEGAVRWCSPSDYGPGLAADVGRFKTQGWAIDTWTVSEGLSSERHCLEDSNRTAEDFEQLLEHELARPDVDLFVHVFSFTDRIQHVFLRFADPTHPGYDADLAREYEGAVREAYERMDRIVGRARELAPPDALFVVLSDHGFAQFRRGVNLNRWLINHGYLVLKRDPCVGGDGGGRTLDDLFEDRSRIFGDVDWTRTKAFALGLGNVYVNLAGREPEGIVRPGREYRELVARLSRELESLVDDATGQAPVAKVHHRDETYEGYDPVLVPDLRVANNPGYRVSWDTSLGGAPCAEIQDNEKPWGADHCSLEPSLVKGILFANRPLAVRDPEMADLAPSILAVLGLEPPDGAAGRILYQ